jgi:hypothetical protein
MTDTTQVTEEKTKKGSLQDAIFSRALPLADAEIILNAEPSTHTALPAAVPAPALVSSAGA